jgi:maltose alpha-D-glucosyltransferase/alpha-amylase
MKRRLGVGDLADRAGTRAQRGILAGVVRTEAPEALALRYELRGVSMLTMHTFSNRRQTLTLDPRLPRGDLVVDVFDGHHSRSKSGGGHTITLPPYGHRWYRWARSTTR